MKVFTDKEFINKLKWLVNEVPNVYHSENGTWCTKHDGKVWLDCVVSIKGLLWGFINDYSINNRGGAIYGSNGVADFGANQGINYCDGASKDFHNLIPGEYLCMKDTPYSHAGVYIGNGKVFEVTTAWGVNGATISDIDGNVIGGHLSEGCLINTTAEIVIIEIDNYKLTREFDNTFEDYLEKLKKYIYPKGIIELYEQRILSLKNPQLSLYFAKASSYF